MTIAVGVLATHGVVLAADTQLTVSNYWKGDHGKIMAIGRRHPGPRGACAITGATDRFAYLHALGDEVCQNFIDNLTTADKHQAKRQFEDVVHTFHTKHVVPFPDLPSVSILIAYQRGDKRALFQSERSAVVEQPEFGTVGIGSFAAGSVLARLWKPGLDVATAVALSIFAVAVAKGNVDGCGLYTDAIAVEEGMFYRIPRKLVNEVDRLCRMFLEDLEPALIRDALGEGENVTLDAFKGGMKAIIEEIREKTPNEVKQSRIARLEALRAKSGQKSTKVKSSGQPPSQV